MTTKVPTKVPTKVSNKSVELKKVKRVTQRSKKRSKNRTISIKNRKSNKINVQEVSKKMKQTTIDMIKAIT